MKKSLLYIILFLLIPASLSAYHAKARINAGYYSKIRVFINGELMNHKPLNEVRLDYVLPGKHRARVEIFTPYGKRVIRDRIFIKQGHMSSFVVDPHYGYHGIRRVAVRPLYYKPVKPYRGRKFNAVRHQMLNDLEFETLKSQLESARFDGDKINLVKEALRYRTLYSEEVRYFMDFFTYESSRLKLTKYAYHKVVDKKKYHLVNDGFRFNSTRRELERYIYQYPM